ncbi:MAG: 4-hydroxy-tetrahydrodipicolinate synthase [Victivallaceae bacterium]
MLNLNLWTALITPFLSCGKIDYDGLSYLMAMHSREGNGLLLLGSTGEGFLLEDIEKRELIDHVFKSSYACPVIIGVTSTNLASTLNWMSFCKDYPISGFLISAPIYTRPGIRGQIDWFEKLLNYSDRPVMLYNIPQRTGVFVYKEVVEELSSHENFWAIKESGNCLGDIVHYRDCGLKVFCGNDDNLEDMANVGATGLVSVIANIWPSFVSDCLNRLSENGFSEDISSLWKKICQPFALATNPIPLKVLMQHLGLINCGQVRTPLSLNDLSSIEPLLNAHKLVSEFTNGLSLFYSL